MCARARHHEILDLLGIPVEDLLIHFRGSNGFRRWRRWNWTSLCPSIITTLLAIFVAARAPCAIRLASIQNNVRALAVNHNAMVIRTLNQVSLWNLGQQVQSGLVIRSERPQFGDLRDDDIFV